MGTKGTLCVRPCYGPWAEFSNPMRLRVRNARAARVSDEKGMAENRGIRARYCAAVKLYADPVFAACFKQPLATSTHERPNTK